MKEKYFKIATQLAVVLLLAVTVSGCKKKPKVREAALPRDPFICATKDVNDDPEEMAKAGCYNMLRQYIKDEYDMDVTNNELFLLAAVKNNNEEKVKELLAAGTDVNFSKEEDINPLYCCADKVSMVKLLLDNGADPNIDKGYVPAPDYWWEEEYQKEKEEIDAMFKELVAHGAKFGKKWGEILPSLIIENHFELFQILLDGGADPNAQNEGCYGTAWAWARVSTHPEYLKLLQNSGIKEKFDKNIVLRVASENNNLQLVKEMLQKGADVNFLCKKSQVPALTLALFGDFKDDSSRAELVRTLLDAGANAKYATKKSGLTALMVASFWHKKGDAEIVKMLLEAGANVNAQQKWRHPRTKKWKDGNTALMLASHVGNTDVIKLLLAAGADVNMQSSEGETALIKATLENHPEAVKLLLEAGADTRLYDNQGDNALYIAKKKEYSEIVKLLEASK